MSHRGTLLLVVTSLLAGGLVTHASASPDFCGSRAAAARERAALVTGSGEFVAVIGDSYAVGAGLAHRADSWPAYLPGRVYVDGFSGSGFSRAASPCAGVAYADRAARALATRPSLVVVEGGLNEYDVPTREVEAGARRLLRRLAGTRAVFVGPAGAPARAGEVDRIDAALARVAAAAGTPYVSAKGWVIEYQPDRLHPTAAGHREFGRRVRAALAAAIPEWSSLSSPSGWAP